MDVADEISVRAEERPPAAPGLGRCWWALGAVLALGLLLARAHLLWGTAVMAGALLLAAAGRLLLPQEQAGGLVVRGRTFDTLVLLILAGAVLLSAFTLDLDPR